MADLFQPTNAEAVQFGVRAIGMQAARLCCQAYTEAKEKFDAGKPGEKGFLGIEMQKAKKDMDEAVQINRSRLKTIVGGRL